MRIAIILIAILMLTGCYYGTDSGESRTFDLKNKNFNGEPVSSCSPSEADQVCRDHDYDEAIDWECEIQTVHTGFYGTWEMTVMTTVTCWRD